MRLDREMLARRFQETRYWLQDLSTGFRTDAQVRRKVIIIGAGGSIALILLVVRVATWLPGRRHADDPAPAPEAMAKVQRDAAAVRPEIESDPRFANVKVLAIPPSDKQPGGKVMVIGGVASEADLARLKQLVEKAHPGVPVTWQVAVGK